MTPADAAHSAHQDDGRHQCGNCGAALSGPYCAQCGQHAHASARNLAAVLHDGWHDLTHVDGRLWLTLWSLFTRPGRLTVDYFHERRARYLPPVRLYLVLSLVFFSFNLGEEHEHGAAAHAPRDSIIDLGKTAGICGHIQLAGVRSLERATREACERILADGGATFGRTLLHNVPKMMFVFLPLMAGVMWLLYWRPTHFYVEHLVFLLHNHSALFLCFALMALAGTLGEAWPAISTPADLIGIAGSCYVFWYPYAALRRFYVQSRWLTAAKFLVIGLAYCVCLLLTLLGTAVITALNY